MGQVNLCVETLNPYIYDMVGIWGGGFTNKHVISSHDMTNRRVVIIIVGVLLYNHSAYLYCCYDPNRGDYKN